MTETTPETDGPGWGGQLHRRMLTSMLLLLIAGYLVGLLSVGAGTEGKIGAIVLGGSIAVFALWWAPGAGEIASEWERDQA